MNNQDMKVDLHVHTSFSGGALTPGQVVEHAAEKKLDGIAITDTCSVEGIKDAFRAAREFSINIVPGLELIAHENGYEISILGLFVDPDHSALEAELPYYKCGRRRFAPIEAIRLIRKSMGIPILANPIKSLNGSCKNEQILKEKLSIYKKWGVIGVEVYRPEHDAETTALLKQVTEGLGMLCSGGSDFYTPGDDDHQLGNVDIPSNAWNKLRTVAIEQDILSE